jgi:DNA polymerase-4/protein ImuB
LPVEYLQLPPDILKRLGLLGLRTVGDLATLPFSAIQAEFGPAGARAWKLANGQDESPIVPRQSAQTVLSSLRFEHPLASIDAILAAVSTLLARTFGNPAVRGHSVRKARLHGLLSDESAWERLITFKEAVSSKEVAYDALKSKLNLPQALPTAPLEELSLELLGLGGEWAKQPNLFTVHAKKHAEVGEATRQLQARYGHAPIYRAMEVEPWSRVPERRWALIPYEP